MSQIADANALVQFIKDFTGSTNDAEVKECIFMGEMMMRNVELPIQRSDPYNSQFQAVADSSGMIPIPGDMLKPIIFFKMGGTQGSSQSGGGNGPWIVYDRVGDREIIRRRMIDQLYIRPFGVPRVIRASFSEVGGRYVFTPNPGDNVTIKAYYQRAFPFLFGATGDALFPIVQTNQVLASFPEGYMYATLGAYYDKNKNVEEAQKWNGRFDDSYGLIQDQNFKDKWRGGDQHLTSEFQPRSYRYSFK